MVDGGIDRMMVVVVSSPFIVIRSMFLLEYECWMSFVTTAITPPCYHPPLLSPPLLSPSLLSPPSAAWVGVPSAPILTYRTATPPPPLPPWVGVGWQRHCKSCCSLLEQDSQGPNFISFFSRRSVSAGGRVRSFVAR